MLEKTKNQSLSSTTFKSVSISPKLTLINKLKKGNKNNSVNMIKSFVFSNQPKTKFRKKNKNDKISKNSKINFYILSVVVIFTLK